MQDALDSEETSVRESCRHCPLLRRERSVMAVVHNFNPHPAGRRRKPGSPAGAQKLTCSFVHGICLLGGKADVGHFPSRGKYNNTRKHQALWECSKVGAAAPSRAQTKGRASLGARPAEHRGRRSGSQSPGCPRPCFAVTFLPSATEIADGEGASRAVRHRKRRPGLSYDTRMHTHRSVSDGYGLSGLRLTPQMGRLRQGKQRIT